jgi:hypothetical protein
LSLAHASGARPACPPSLSVPLREALDELASAFAALAEGNGAAGAQAAAHATRAKVLVTGDEQRSGPHAQLIAELVDSCADDTLRLTATTCNVNSRT